MRVFLLFFLFSPIVAVSQFKFYMHGIVGQYSMKDMKQIQSEFEAGYESSGIPAKSVTEFPMSLQVEIGADKEIPENNLAIGGFLNYGFTKGRVDYQDYSGQTYANQNVSRIVLGGKAAKLLPYGFSLYGKIGLNYSMLNMSFVTKINGVGSDEESIDFYSIGLNLEPGGSWTYMSGKFGFSVLAGYEVNIQGKTMLKEDTDAYLQTAEGDKALINWSGMRMALSVSFSLD
jgi:hypothetical protein